MHNVYTQENSLMIPQEILLLPPKPSIHQSRLTHPEGLVEMDKRDIKAQTDLPALQSLQNATSLVALATHMTAVAAYNGTHSWARNKSSYLRVHPGFHFCRSQNNFPDVHSLARMFLPSACGG